MELIDCYRSASTTTVSKVFGEFGAFKQQDDLIKIIHGGEIEELEKLLNCKVLLHQFKARLLEVRVPRNSVICETCHVGGKLFPAR